MKAKVTINVWCSSIFQGESNIHIEDKETGEDFIIYTYALSDNISLKELFNKTGKIKGSYFGLSKVLKQLREEENYYYKQNEYKRHGK